MVQIVADLHLHSKYSRAVSPQMVPETMAKYAKQKGLDLLATGDWTHPMWYRELESQLEESEEGIYSLKKNKNNVILSSSEESHSINKLSVESDNKKTKFILSVEISCIYTQNGKGRRVHNLVFAPGFEAVEKINKELINRGYNLTSDGRPIIGLSSKNLLQLILEIDERCMLIPAHIWTPWFGVLGQASGFNSLQECFEELATYVYGIETGLSSDPEMNWQVKELNNRSILSFSDAHSPAKMGREATVFELEKLTYGNIREAIMTPSRRFVIPSGASPKASEIEESESRKSADEIDPSTSLRFARDDKGKNRVLYTLEFYPEEGKYHYSGHRLCNVTMTPREQRESKGICPVCHKPVTDGVMRRVQELANEDPRSVSKMNEKKLKWHTDPKSMHPPFLKLVPLNEIIAEAIGSPVGSTKVKVLFDKLCEQLESEINVLLKAEVGAIEEVGGVRVAEGVQKVREGTIVIKPGYDGVYGVVKIWPPSAKATERQAAKNENKKQVEQIGLF